MKLFSLNNSSTDCRQATAVVVPRANPKSRAELDVNSRAAPPRDRLQILETVQPIVRRSRQHENAPPPREVFNSHPT